MSANSTRAACRALAPGARPTIELCDDQVAAVLRHAQGAPRTLWSLVGSGKTDPEMLAELGGVLDSRKMSQSLFRGLWLMLRLDAADDWTGVAELAEMSSMTPSTVHRYLATLLAFGIVEQHSHSRRYRVRGAG